MSTNDTTPGIEAEALNQAEQQDSSVECLGKTFENDTARREYYLEILAEKLKDPRFREIEGFPIGEDEDILNLSDPPYYTACPNPFIEDFISLYGRPYDPAEEYKREPYAADVSEGKNDPIYNAHSYHTKVPHKAIMRYILHYTEPGDIVFDGFCGTGMTGVAAQMCGDKQAVLSLGYQVKQDGTILQKETDEKDNKTWRAFSKLGVRRAILNDLSPAATFIAYNYNTPVDVAAFEREAKRILKEVEDECGWMYETLHADGKTKGKINYTIWSDVFVCPECANEVIFWEVAVNKDTGKIKDTFPCSHCQAELTKRNMERAWATHYDSALEKTINQAKQVPVLINYLIVGQKGRFEKKPDEYDFTLIEKIENTETTYWYPSARMMEGKETRRNDKFGITHVHHFYTKAAMWKLAALWVRFTKSGSRVLRAISLSLTAASPYASKLRRFRAGKKGGGPLAGTLYIASLITPPNVLLTIDRNIGFIGKGLRSLANESNAAITSVQSNDNYYSIPDKSLDYIFIDPPFGSNLNYSELNYLWEVWLKVVTNNKPEAIENSVQNKGPTEYRQLMTLCFKEAYRVLKPGRWMTVEFSNTKASVWNSIQTSLNEAGFIIANISALDKKQGSFKAVTTTTAVKQDLVISAYKPNGGFEQRFVSESDEEGIWDFIRTHLGYLPIVKKQDNELVKIPERDSRILFDQVVAYFVRNLRDVPLSSKEFQEGLLERFTERDDMIFLPEQVAEYDKARMSSSQLRQLTIFVNDEASSIEWLRQLLNDKPQTYQDIHPKFIKELSGYKKAEMQLELTTWV
ncbi:MAG: DNA methyltransferase [Methylococcaceae bacterium]